MNTGHKTIVAVLAVVAVLLSVNILQGPRAAEAQEVGDGEPYVVKWLPSGSFGYLRVWSDGQVDHWRRPDEQGNCEFEFLGVDWPAVDHPFPVVDAEGGVESMIIKFEDGRIDLLGHPRTRCTISGDGGAPLCLGDVDRDGDNDFDDLLFVLSGWGLCE